jgi:malonyl CoA-acyl carrier protein transacylase
MKDLKQEDPEVQGQGIMSTQLIQQLVQSTQQELNISTIPRNVERNQDQVTTTPLFLLNKSDSQSTAGFLTQPALISLDLAVMMTCDNSITKNLLDQKLVVITELVTSW